MLLTVYNILMLKEWLVQQCMEYFDTEVDLS